MKRFVCALFALLMCVAVTVGCFASDEVSGVRSLLVDDGDILSDGEEKELLSRLDSFSEKNELDLVIVSVDTLDDEDLEDFANGFYESKGYGQGSDKDGMLLLLVMDTRDWCVSKNGYALTAFTDAGFDYIIEKIKSDLGDGSYAEAFADYVELCDDFVAQARTGSPYTANNLPKEPFKVLPRLIVSVVIGFVIALIVTGGMKGQLKTVRSRSEATDYTKPGSFQVNESRDLFLYRNVSRREKVKEESSQQSDGGGSSRNQSGKF